MPTILRLLRLGGLGSCSFLAILSATGCGKENFRGAVDGSSTEEKSKENASNSNVDPAQGDNTQSSTANSTATNPGAVGQASQSNEPSLNKDDKDAIDKCVQAWGKHPFTQEQLQRPRKIAASINIAGLNIGPALTDTAETPEPQLVLVGAAIDIAGKSLYQLLNPNGWYCIKVGVGVLAQTHIKLNCKAHLASNKLDIKIGSQVDAPTARVGVYVLSRVEVESVGSCP